jgi:hypothetical protein
VQGKHPSNAYLGSAIRNVGKGITVRSRENRRKNEEEEEESMKRPRIHSRRNKLSGLTGRTSGAVSTLSRTLLTSRHEILIVSSRQIPLQVLQDTPQTSSHLRKRFSVDQRILNHNKSVEDRGEHVEGTLLKALSTLAISLLSPRNRTYKVRRTTNSTLKTLLQNVSNGSKPRKRDRKLTLLFSKAAVSCAMERADSAAEAALRSAASAKRLKAGNISAEEAASGAGVRAALNSAL